MFVNLGTFDKKSGRKGKFGFPFSRGHYTPPEFIPDDTKKGEMTVALAFLSTILPYRNVTGFRLNEDDSNKGADIFIFENGKEIPVQISRLTFNYFPRRRKIAESKGRVFAELIYKEIPVPFVVHIQIMPQDSYLEPLRNLRANQRDKIEKELLEVTIEFVKKSIPLLQHPPYNHQQYWIKEPELGRYFSSISIQIAPKGFFSHHPSYNSIHVEYAFSNSGYNNDDVKKALDKMYDRKNEGLSETLILWANDYELFDRDAVAKEIAKRFAETTFNEIFFLAFHDIVHIWAIKQKGVLVTEIARSQQKSVP
jgi:hypothetical protein